MENFWADVSASYLGRVLVAAGFVVVWGMVTPTLHTPEFWLTQCPRVSGEIRFVVYALILFCALYSPRTRPPHGDSPLHTRKLIRHAFPPEFVSPQGMMKSIPWFYNGDGWHLDLFHHALWVSWVLCIVGLGGQLPALVHATTFLVGVGANTGLIGISHRWYIPAYTFTCMCLVDSRHTFSIDSLLCDRFKSSTSSSSTSSYPFCPSTDGLLASGFAAQWVTITCMYTLVSGGFTKLMNEGFSWSNGESMRFYLSFPAGAFPPMKKLVTSVPFVATFLSTSTLIFEIGSIVAIYGIGREIVVILAWSFHLGIWMTMKPNYLPQSICYFIVINLNPLAYLAGIGETGLPPSAAVISLDSLFPPSSIIPQIALTCSCWFLLILCYVTCWRVEHFPLTAIPMYSLGRDSSFKYDTLASRAQLMHLAREHAALRYPRTLSWGNWLELYVEEKDGTKTDLLSGKWLSRKEVITLINHNTCMYLTTTNVGERENGHTIQWLENNVATYIRRLGIVNSQNDYSICISANFANNDDPVIVRVNMRALKPSKAVVPSKPDAKKTISAKKK